MLSTRLPRFRRAPEVRSLRLTARDIEIIRYVARYRFLRSTHITALLDGAPQPILRRLQLLYHHGFLERPRSQIDYYSRGGGSKAIVYGLAAKGVAVIKWGENVRPFDSHRYTSSNEGIRRLFLEHTLQVADILVQFELTCRAHPGVRFLVGREIQAEANKALSWNVQVGQTSRLGIIPDAVFALEKSGSERVVYFLESDCGTMPVERINLSRSSITRKLVGYHATWQQNLHRRRFGWERFRVLTITTNADRVRHMIDAARKLPNGLGLFLFQDIQSVRNATDLLSIPFQTATGVVATLLA